MSWLDRLSGSISFVSPEGREFQARWKGSDRSKSKKLGAFSPPRRTGTVFQDLDISATSYPMSIHFDGENHDLVSRQFFSACDENGLWGVTHPVHGLLMLQLVSVTQKDEPVNNGNLTVFELDWVEPINNDSIVSSARIAEQIQAQLIQINNSSADQIESVSDQRSSFTIQSLRNSISSVNTSINETLRPLSELNTDISRITNEIQRGINSVLISPILPIASISSQIQNISQLPSMATDNIQSRVAFFSTLINSIMGIEPSEISLSGRNEIAVKELVLVSALGALPQIVSTGVIQTRQEAIQLAEFLQDSFVAITSSLDSDQELFSNQNIDIQYFSQRCSYSDSARIVSLGVEFLLRASLDLRIERRFFLERDRSPVEITISEYGTLGLRDENLDLFISSNNLKGEEIILLPAGREVVIYV